MADLFLYNSFTPRKRAPGDVFLDNSIGILRTRLMLAGIDFIIEDRMTIEGYNDFKYPQVTKPLRELFKKAVFPKRKNSKLKELFYGFKIKNLYSRLVKFHDLKMDEYLGRITETVVRGNIPVFGIKLWSGSTFRYCEKLCAMIHEASPETVIVVGGPQVNCFYADGLILKDTAFDLAVYSEGEEAIVNIVKIARQHKTRKDRIEAIVKAGIPNLIYRAGSEVKVNPPVYGPINEKLIPEYTPQELSSKIKSHTIINGIGCDYARCTFCIHPQIHREFHLRETRLVVDEIELMLKRGISFFTFTASDTPVPQAKSISEEILRRGLRIEFTMLTRAWKSAGAKKDYLIEAYRTIIRAGLRIVFMGAESGNDEVLKEVMNKDLASQDIVDTVKCIRKASELENVHVYIITSYIFPCPLTENLVKKGITMEQVYEDNIALAKRTMPDSFQVIPAIVYAGTKWYCEPEKYNISLDKEIFAKIGLRAEISVHILVDKSFKSPYSFLGKSIAEWFPLHIKQARAINALGIPSDLMDEHLLMARCAGYSDLKKLEEMSMEIFLDIISCDYEISNRLLEQINVKSAEIASGKSEKSGKSGDAIFIV
ncbi:MAG: B12-binding domain-containing radical SAM protein [Candidatus Omnitrophota bacterium]|nr:B12-binding domain-containing radical SAM protein [Candidatus Omnitrophota bacterium]